jgi:hypothetical protein
LAPKRSRKKPSPRSTRATITNAYTRYVRARAIHATAIAALQFGCSIAAV